MSVGTIVLTAAVINVTDVKTLKCAAVRSLRQAGDAPRLRRLLQQNPFSVIPRLTVETRVDGGIRPET